MNGAWFVGSAIVVLYITMAAIFVLGGILTSVIRKYRERKSSIALYLLLHVLMFFVGFLITVIILFTEYAHDFWGWDVPYLRRYLIGITYSFCVIGVIFLVYFVDAVFNLPKKLRTFFVIYGILLFPIIGHPSNHWEFIHMEEYSFDLRVISGPLFAIYVVTLAIVMIIKAFRAAGKASERKYSIGMRFIGYGGIFMFFAVVFLFIDTIIAITWQWYYNVAAWISWICIMCASLCFYFGYALPQFLIKLLKL